VPPIPIGVAFRNSHIPVVDDFSEPPSVCNIVQVAREGVQSLRVTLKVFPGTQSQQVVELGGTNQVGHISSRTPSRLLTEFGIRQFDRQPGRQLFSFEPINFSAAEAMVGIPTFRVRTPSYEDASTVSAIGENGIYLHIVMSFGVMFLR